MVQSVELLLDVATEEIVRRSWTELIDRGLPSAGRHSGPTNRPHVTLAVSPGIPANREAWIAGAVRDLPLPVRLGGVLVFGRGPFIVARLVVPTLALLALQSRTAFAVGDHGFPHIRPDAWTPHVTLARRVPAADMPMVLSVVTDGSGVAGQAVAARRWDSDARRDWLIAP